MLEHVHRPTILGFMYAHSFAIIAYFGLCSLLCLPFSSLYWFLRHMCAASVWDLNDSVLVNLVEYKMVVQALCDAYCGENYGSTDFDVLENVRDAILRMAYYW